MITNYFQKPITKRFIDAFPKFKQEKGETTLYFWETWLASPFYDASLTESDIRKIYYRLLDEEYN